VDGIGGGAGVGDRTPMIADKENNQARCPAIEAEKKEEKKAEEVLAEVAKTLKAFQ
jgi:hypothetical protein